MSTLKRIKLLSIDTNAKTVKGQSEGYFIEPNGVIVALYAKGKAKKDTSGFVIDNTMPVFALQQA